MDTKLSDAPGKWVSVSNLRLANVMRAMLLLLLAVLISIPAGCTDSNSQSQLHTAAMTGNPTAEAKFGNYLCGHGNSIQGWMWIHKAAEGGSSQAEAWLSNRDGELKDYHRAVYWARMAATRGNAMGMWELGLCYDNGLGVPRDYAVAYDWEKRAAGAGNASAKVWIYYNPPP